MLGDELADRGNEIDWNLHRRVVRRLEGRLVFGQRLIVGLRCIVLEHAPNTGTTTEVQH